MFSALRRLFTSKPADEERDRISEALRAGRKDEAVRHIADEGVWIPIREQKRSDDGGLSIVYFDTDDCFPVFSSAALILPYLQRAGEVDATKLTTAPAHQVGGDFFTLNPDLARTTVLNPASDTAWRLGPAEFEMIKDACTRKG